MPTSPALINAFLQDEKYEGDVNNFPVEEVASCLEKGLIKIHACDRQFKNARLTAKGIRLAKQSGG